MPRWPLPAAGAVLSSDAGETIETLIDRLAPMFLDPLVEPTVTNKTPGPGRDILTASSNNLYAGVSASHLDLLHRTLRPELPSHG